MTPDIQDRDVSLKVSLQHQNLHAFTQLSSTPILPLGCFPKASSLTSHKVYFKAPFSTVFEHRLHMGHKFDLKPCQISLCSKSCCVNFTLLCTLKQTVLVSELFSQYLWQHRNLCHSDSILPPPKERLEDGGDILVLMRKIPATTSPQVGFPRKWSPVLQLPLDFRDQDMVSGMMERGWRRSRFFPFLERSSEDSRTWKIAGLHSPEEREE